MHACNNCHSLQQVSQSTVVCLPSTCVRTSSSNLVDKKLDLELKRSNDGRR